MKLKVAGSPQQATQLTGLLNAAEVPQLVLMIFPTTPRRPVTKEAAPVGVIRFLVWLSKATAALALKKEMLINKWGSVVEGGVMGAAGPLDLRRPAAPSLGPILEQTGGFGEPSPDYLRPLLADKDLEHTHDCVHLLPIRPNLKP